jgi:hypothetical protein
MYQFSQKGYCFESIAHPNKNKNTFSQKPHPKPHLNHAAYRQSSSMKNSNSAIIADIY